jgi:hypothetical protein
MVEERGLGQDLRVQEAGRGLKWDRGELVEAMEPAGRVDVLDGDGEDELPGEPAEPSGQALVDADPPLPDDVVAVVDRLQERVEMGRRPEVERGRD